VSLGRDAILSADDRPVELIAVPEWGGDVAVRGCTAAERDSWEAHVLKGRDTATPMIRAALVVRCLVDDAGVRLFADADADAVAAKSARAVDRLYDVAARLSGIGAGSAADAEKN
jgi:hypothetical protein